MFVWPSAHRPASGPSPKRCDHDSYSLPLLSRATGHSPILPASAYVRRGAHFFVCAIFLRSGKKPIYLFLPLNLLYSPRDTTVSSDQPRKPATSDPITPSIFTANFSSHIHPYLVSFPFHPPSFFRPCVSSCSLLIPLRVAPAGSSFPLQAAIGNARGRTSHTGVVLSSYPPFHPHFTSLHFLTPSETNAAITASRLRRPHDDRRCLLGGVIA